MKRALIPLILWLSAQVAFAQEASPAPPGDVDNGVSLMEEGAKLLLKGLLSNMEPAMQEMGRALTEMQPALNNLLTMMGDVTKYHAPELLDNGDIIIRRKTPAELAPTGPEVDL